MTFEKTPYEMAEEILGLAQALVLELGGQDNGPPGNAGGPAGGVAAGVGPHPRKRLSKRPAVRSDGSAGSVGSVGCRFARCPVRKSPQEDGKCPPRVTFFLASRRGRPWHPACGSVKRRLNREVKCSRGFWGGSGG